MSNYSDRGRNSRKKKSKGINYNDGEKKFGLFFVIQFVVLGILIISACIYLFASIARGKESDRLETLNPDSTISEVIKGNEKETTDETESSTDFNETEELLAGNIKLDNISIEGLSKSEAKKRILDTYNWGVQLSYLDNLENLNNPLPEIVDSLLDEIYANPTMPERGEYLLDSSLIENSLRTQLAGLAEKWNREPTSAQLTGRDKVNNQWIYSEGETGIKVNQEKTIEKLMALVSDRQFKGTVDVETEQVFSGTTTAEIKKQYKVISTYSTVATSNQNRNNNIAMAMNALDGLILNPGDEFSFNKTTGNRTIERGYKPAGAYRNGEFVEEPGGGVCQVSSTLYNAIIFSGLTVKERNPHSYEPAYVVPGEDAMVSYDGYSGPDLRFVNNQNTSIGIRAVFENNKLTISIVAIPILDDGVEISMRSEKIKTNNPLEPKYEEDPTLSPGEEVIVSKGISSTVWKTYLVTKKNGVVVKEENFHSTTYRAKAAVIRRNSAEPVPVPEVPVETGEMPATEGETQPDAGGINETIPPEIIGTEPSESPSGTNEYPVLIVPGPGTQNPEPTADSSAEVGPGVDS